MYTNAYVMYTVKRVVFYYSDYLNIRDNNIHILHNHFILD